ncbi:hypothetical protein HN51_032451 [Arachis hypogaea]
MEKKQKIVQYRERLDKILASPDLTNDEMIKKTCRKPTSYKQKLLEMKTVKIIDYNPKFAVHKTKQNNKFEVLNYNEGAIVNATRAPCLNNIFLRCNNLFPD